MGALESSGRKRLPTGNKNLVEPSWWRMCDPAFWARRMIHISQNQGRVWNAVTKWSCSSPGELCCLTLRFSVWTSAAHLICVRLTRRIRVQSVHLSPPTLPTAALLVIKPPDQPAAHREMNNDCADEEGARHNFHSPHGRLGGWIPAMTHTRRQQKPLRQPDCTSLLLQVICDAVIHRLFLTWTNLKNKSVCSWG